MRLSKIKSLVLYLLTISFILWIAGFIYFANYVSKMTSDTDIKVDGIVALTGGRNRIQEGFSELNRDNGKSLFISGVDEHITLEQLLEQNEATNIDKNKVFLDYNSYNTNENARETSKWVKSQKYKSIKLITSSYHMPRSLLEFKYIMPDIKIIAHPVNSDYVKMDKWWKFSGTTSFIAIEYSKFLVIYFKLYILNWSSKI